MTRASVVLALIALLLVLAPTPASARMYSPCASAGPANTTPGVSSDLTFHYGFGLGPDCVVGTTDDAADYLNSITISFTPKLWGVATDAAIPDGAQVGNTSTRLTVGQYNLSCLSSITVSGDLVDATLSRQESVPSESSGEPRFFQLFNDGDTDGAPDGANKWPAFLTDLADREDWDLDRLRSRAIGFDSTTSPGSFVMFNLLTFEPGAPFGDSRLGYPTIRVLNDPTLPRSPDSAISRTCSPVVTDWTLFGSVNGTPYRTNPTDGEYFFVSYSEALPDADDDGIENFLDVCPLSPDFTWDPRSMVVVDQPGDPDQDGISDTCDPFPDVASASQSGPLIDGNEDGDGWINRADNCPLAANEDQLDSDEDGIGDACDPNSAVPDGHRVWMCNTSEVTVGAGGVPPSYPNHVWPCAGNASDSADCFGSPPYGEVLAILGELAGTRKGTLCFPAADNNCDGSLTLGDAIVVLLYSAQLVILRPCDFYGGLLE